MSERTPLQSRNSRQPYRSQVRTPRQTLHNQKRRKVSFTSPVASADSGLEKENTSFPDCSSNLECDFSRDACCQDQADLQEPQASTCPIVPPTLFDGSTLSTSTSHLLISSYINRHHLTGQAQTDLLQLLRLHLPQENTLASSLYTFRKQSVSSISDADDLKPTYHFYCARCCMLLSSTEFASGVCSNGSCNAAVSEESSPNFITVSVAQQLQLLFLSKLGLI